MSLILNIDTALDAAFVCLAKDNEVLQSSVNGNQENNGRAVISQRKQRGLNRTEGART